MNIVYILVFLSGISGLIYEIVWIRALGRHFGTTAPAISTVLAAFMGGLALGNYLLGRRADRSKEPFKLYRWLEVGIAISGCMVSLLLLRGDLVLDMVARWTAATGPAEVMVRFLVFSSLLMVPATLMGGTLPVLARALTRTGASGRVLGALYAVNTIGAVVGALLPDLLLVPAAGLTAAVLVAVGVNLVVALGAGRLSASTGVEPLGAGPMGRLDRKALVLYTVSGFCAMGFEILWSRVIEHWTAAYVTTFSMLLAVFLLTLSLGSWVARKLADRVQNPLVWAAALLALLAPAVLVPLALAPEWLAFVEGIHPTPELARPPLGHTLVRAVLYSLWLEGTACFVMGAAFPFLAAAAIRAGSAGRQTGTLYAANTVAGVFGAIITGFLILPHLGQQHGFFLLTFLSGMTGLGMLLVFFPKRRAFAWTGVGATLAAVTIAATLPADHLRSICFVDTADEMIAIREGPTTTVGVRQHERFGEPVFMSLVTPGISMSDSSFGAQRYMGLMGHLGVFYAHEPRNALLICYGLGNTARAILSHPDIERLDVVDISMEVFAVGHLFEAVHGLDPLEDPRTERFVDDGRHHLVVTDRTYDVITSEPPPPNNAGIVNLYSREYYQTARKRLRPGGVLTQWLPVFQLAEPETAAIVAAFLSEFEHTALFYGYGYQWILAGSDEPLTIDLTAWNARWRQPTVQSDLKGIGVEGVNDLVATFMQDDTELREVMKDQLPLTDDLPLIQYPWKSVAAPGVPPGLIGDPYDVMELIEPPPRSAELAALHTALEATRRFLAVMHLSGLRPPEWKELVFGTAMRRALGKRTDHQATLALLKIGDDYTSPALSSLEAGRMDREALAVLVRRDFYVGRYARAFEALEATGSGLFPPPLYWLLRGGCQRALGRPQEASAAFERAAQASSHDDFRDAMKTLAAEVNSPFPPLDGPLYISRD